MAWLKYRGTPARGRWHALWTERIGGRARKRSRALSRDRRAAETMLHEIERNLAMKGVGLGQAVPLTRLRADYLKLLAANGGAPTYLTRVRIVLDHLERLFPGVKVPALTAPLIDDYKLKRLAEGVGAATLNRELGVIKAAVRKGRRWQYQVADLADVSRVRAAEQVRGGYSADEVRALLAVTDPTLRLVTHLGLYAGLRRMEMVALRWADVDWANAALTLGQGWKTKSGRARAVPLHPELARVLRDRQAAGAVGERVLAWEKTLPALSGRYVYHLRRKLGIAHGGLHSLRHTFLTTLKRLDMDTAKIQRVAGHANERTTQGYVHLDVGDLRPGVERVKYA